MSAYIVDRATIHALVHAALTDNRHQTLFRYRWDGRSVTVDGLHADAAGEMLTRENVRSVRTRYPDSNGDDLPGRIDLEWAAPYTFPTRDAYQWPAPDAVVILKVLGCYEYQTCETDDWEQTEAYAFCDALRRSLIHQLPGYEDAPWGLDEYPVRKRVAA